MELELTMFFLLQKRTDLNLKTTRSHIFLKKSDSNLDSSYKSSNLLYARRINNGSRGNCLNWAIFIDSNH